MKPSELYSSWRRAGTPFVLLAVIGASLGVRASITDVAGYFTANDSFQHAIVGDTDGRVHEVYFNPADGISNDQLGCFRHVKAITGFFTPDDQLEHVIVATAEGVVSEIYFNSAHAAQEAVLGQFDGLVDIGGFYTADDGYRHVIVGTASGDVTEIFYQPSAGIFQALIGHYDPGIVALDGFYTPDDDYRHVIVATGDGAIHELFFNPQLGAGDAVLSTKAGIVDVAGFYSSDDGYRHVIVATSNGDISELFYDPLTGNGQAHLASLTGVARIAAYFTPTDSYRHVIVGRTNGAIEELFYHPQAGFGQDTLASFQPLAPTISYFGPDATASPADASRSSAGLMLALAGDESALYAVSLNAGVWKSVNGGAWVQLPGSPRYARGIAVDPNNPAHLAVGERDGDAANVLSNRAGVWESFDGGATWAFTLNPLSRSGCGSQAISAIAFSPAATLFIGTPCGLGRKAPGESGFDFSHTPGGAGWITAICMSESKVWARTFSSLLVSSDDGLNWSRIPIPSQVAGYNISFPRPGDPFSLGAFDAFAYLVFKPNPDTVQNHNTLLVYNADSGGWSVQVQTTGNGTGLGGQRFIKSFILSNRPRVVGDGLQLVFGEGQDMERATALNPDGTLQWRTLVTTQGSGAPNKDRVHSDIWDCHWAPDGYAAWLCGDGGVYGLSLPSEIPIWVSQNQGLETHHIHSVTALRRNHVSLDRLAYATSDNDAWQYAPETGWYTLGCLGDANWTLGDVGNPAIALMARSPSYAAITAISDDLPNGMRSECGIAVSDDDTFDGPLFLQFIQTREGEASYPLLDAVMLAHLPLQYRAPGGNLANVPGVLGQSNPGGNPVLIRNPQFAASPDANTSRFQDWQVLANDLPAGARGFWVSGGHSRPVFYTYTTVGGTSSLYKRNVSGVGWERLDLDGLLVGGANGPAFVNPYDPRRLYALTSCGVMVSTDGGASFRGDAVLTGLLTASGKFPITANFPGGNYSGGYIPIASRALSMATLSCVAFNRDNPQAAVAASPFTGVFYDSGDGIWRDLTRYLPTPFTPVAAVAIDCEAIYVATEGRGLLRITGYDNAPAAATPAGSLVKILRVVPSPAVTITWQSSPGISYRAEYKNDLNDPVWTHLAGDVRATCLTASKADPGAAARRFYRIVELP